MCIFMMEEQVCFVCMYDCKRRLMHHLMAVGKLVFTKCRATTNINLIYFSLFHQSLSFKSEAAEDIWKIDEQPDVSDISFDAQYGLKKQFLSYLMFSYF